MTNKQVDQLISDMCDFWCDEKDKIIIIATHPFYYDDTESFALYHNPETGVFIKDRLNWEDTHKYETEDKKLLRLSPSYIEQAKDIALGYMKLTRGLGFMVYTESGFCVSDF